MALSTHEPQLRVARETARRFLVRRHLLDPPRSLPPEPASVLTVFERLGSIQFDPLEVAGRNHDLVLLARVAGYRRAWTDELLYGERRLFEAYNKGLSLLPVEELPWYRLTWDRQRERHEAGVLARHPAIVAEVLDRIDAEGPLSTLDFGAREMIAWGWGPTNQVRAVMEALAESGILGLARRDGNRRFYDRADRLFEADLLTERREMRDQRRHRLLSRYRAHGLLGRSGQAELWMGTAPAKRTNGWDGPTRVELHDELVESGELVPVAIDGVRGPRFVLASEFEELEAADRPMEAPGVAFLAPLDPLVWDRDFLRALWDFDYIWEVYVPEPKRRWGYYVLPLLYGDRLVGRIEPRIDRRAGVLRVLNLWWEPGFDPLGAGQAGFFDAFADALDAHRAFADVRAVEFERPRALRGLAGEVRARLRPGRAGRAGRVEPAAVGR